MTIETDMTTETRLIDYRVLAKAAETLKTVAHPIRLRIVELLEQGERSVTELQAALGVTQSHTSQHLGQLRTRGILASRREGNMVYYSIANHDVVKVIHCMRRV
jgi:ArsR family transcriptional regulator